MSKESALHNNNWCTETKLTNIDLANAMDEYAEEVAVDLIHELRKNHVLMSLFNFYALKSNNEPATDEEIFLFYKNEKEKLCNPSPKI